MIDNELKGSLIGSGSPTISNELDIPKSSLIPSSTEEDNISKLNLIGCCEYADPYELLTEVEWGNIIGRVSDQEDLIAELNKREPLLIAPTVNGYILSSTMAGVRSWIAPLTFDDIIWGNIDGDIDNQNDLISKFNEKENVLGLPIQTGYVLSSDIFGARSWIEKGLSSVSDDPFPELGGILNANGYRIEEVDIVSFDGLFDNGSVITDFEFDPIKGQYQKITIDSDATMSIKEPDSPCTTYLHIHQGTTGGDVTFPDAKWEQQNIGNTTNNPGTGHDLLVIHYYGNSNYVLGMMSNLG